MKRFVADDYSGVTTISAFTQKFFYSINLFLTAAYSAFANGLTLNANTIGMVVDETSVTSSSAGIATTTINWKFVQSPPQGVVVLNCSVNGVAAQAPLISWSYAAGVISVSMQFLRMITSYLFTVSSASATVGATYTNNNQTFTVIETISSGTTLRLTGTGAPGTSGTLTKTSGTGDATITFSANYVLAVSSVAASAATYGLTLWASGG